MSGHSRKQNVKAFAICKSLAIWFGIFAVMVIMFVPSGWLRDVLTPVAGIAAIAFFLIWISGPRPARRR